MKYILFFLLLLNSVVMGQKGDYRFGGYADKVSYDPGDTVHFFISVDRAQFNLRILRFGNTVDLKTVLTDLSGGIQNIPDSSYWYGCRWQEKASLVIPQDWSSGVYFAEFQTSSGSSKRIIFVVRNPLLTNDILFVIGTNTYQLYNNFGGKSGYDFNSSKGKRSYKLSFLRPYTGIGDGNFSDVSYEHYPEFYVPKTGWEPRTITWAEQNGYHIDYCTDTDLETNPNIVSNYKIVLIVGHSEYWSNGMRYQLYRFIHSGGRMIILSGNTGWVQVRFENDHQTIVCYKDKNLDPMYHVTDSLVTVAFAFPPINKPSQPVIGTSWDEGGVVNYIFRDTRILTTDSGYGGYVVLNPDNWVYRGTGLKLLDRFGAEDGIVGYETDGYNHKVNRIDWSFGFPKGFIGPERFTILGYHPANDWNNTRRGNATMGYFFTKEGGAVFNGATTNWTHGLSTNPIIQKITKNVFDRFLSGKFPPEINWLEPKRDREVLVYGDTVRVRKEMLHVFPGDSIAFFVNSRDPLGKTFHSRWTLNGQNVSNHFTYIFKGKGYRHKQELNLQTHVYNDVDTVSLSTSLVYKTMDVMLSQDTQLIAGKKFSYPVDAVSYIGSKLSIQKIESPDWLNYDSLTHAFVGIPTVSIWSGSLGKQRLVFSITDSTGTADTAFVTLNIRRGISIKVDSSNSAPKRFQILPNYPNPFNSATSLSFYLSDKAWVQIDIYNILGQEVVNLYSGYFEKGPNKWLWDVSKSEKTLGSGIYLSRFSARFEHGPRITQVQRILYIK